MPVLGMSANVLHMGVPELARKAGISPTHLRNIEAGRANPTIEVLERLGGPLNRQPAWLLRKAELRTERWKWPFWRERVDDRLND
jgi:transcriptional regulator with XRE-family HTH domain